jgi:small nuclear ribonucleoprotein G
MDKRVRISLNGGRKVSGTLRGFDIFLNLVLDNAVEEAGPTVVAGAPKAQLGQIVHRSIFRQATIILTDSAVL